jgi:arsenate reductase
MDIILYHNPACATSRHVLGLIRNAGVEPHVVEYLKSPPNRAMLVQLLARMGFSARQLLRENAPEFAALGLGAAGVDEATILDAMEAHPILINRPIVVTPKGVRLCRPSEKVLDLLPPQRGEFFREDGTRMIDQHGRHVATV